MLRRGFTRKEPQLPRLPARMGRQGPITPKSATFEGCYISLQSADGRHHDHTICSLSASRSERCTFLGRTGQFCRGRRALLSLGENGEGGRVRMGGRSEPGGARARRLLLRNAIVADDNGGAVAALVGYKVADVPEQNFSPPTFG
jgi:hypothetical protein